MVAWGTGTDPEDCPLFYQYVWSRRYIDAPVRRDWNYASGLTPEVCDDFRLYFSTDANMNVTAAYYDSGAVTSVLSRYDYRAYGEAICYNGTTWQEMAPFLECLPLYCGYYADAETGLYQVRNRYLHPPLGRWTTRDPLNQNQPAGGYQDGMSLYGYARGLPVASRDPKGLDVTFHQAFPREWKTTMPRHIDEFKGPLVAGEAAMTITSGLYIRSGQIGTSCTQISSREECDKNCRRGSIEVKADSVDYGERTVHPEVSFVSLYARGEDVSLGKCVKCIAATRNASVIPVWDPAQSGRIDKKRIPEETVQRSILLHEQGHWLITAIYAHRLQGALEELTATAYWYHQDTLVKELETAVLEMVDMHTCQMEHEWQTRQREYDAELGVSDGGAAWQKRQAEVYKALEHERDTLQ